MAASTPAARSQNARIAALTRSAQEPSGAAMTEKARRTFRESFYEATDPELPEAERRRQGDAAYRAHMSMLAKRSHQRPAAAPPADAHTV